MEYIQNQPEKKRTKRKHIRKLPGRVSGMTVAFRAEMNNGIVFSTLKNRGVEKTALIGGCSVWVER